MKHCLIGYTFIVCISCAFIHPAFADEAASATSTKPTSNSKQGKVLIRGDLISASLKNASLDAVLKDIETQEKIWFKGREALLEEKISVDFVNLPLHEGLKRILAGMNYMMLFDLNGRPVGINILGKKTLDTAGQGKAAQTQPSAAPAPTPPPKVFPAAAQAPRPLPQEGKALSATTRASGPETRAAQAESPGKEKDSEEIPPGFKVIPGAAPPAKPKSAALTQSQAKKFEVIENAPPPGSSTKSAVGGAEKPITIQSSRPPGGTVKMSEEERALFGTARKRTPPAP